MIIFTRRAGEKIMIGDDIVITVLKAGGKALQIGIEAPTGVRVDREEIRTARTAAPVDELNFRSGPPADYHDEPA